MSCTLEINRTALRANLEAVRAAAGDAEVLAVIKADGYGHGGELLASELAAAGVRWMGCSSVAEGRRLRETLGAAAVELLLMVGPAPEDADAIVRERLTPVVWTAAQVAELDRAAATAGRTLAVHIEIDTGMSRQGVAGGDGLDRGLDRLLDAFAHAGHLRVEGVLTHFAESEAGASALVAEQVARFGSALEQVRAAGLQPRWIHAANSSALDTGAALAEVRTLASNFGAEVLVRPGLALLGYALPTEAPCRFHGRLQPVLTWKTRVLDLRDIAAGTAVGYGATFRAPAPMRLALLPVGYADGFRREASSGVGDGWVMVRGERAPVVGRVSMNLTVVDVSRIPAVERGDDAVLLGPGVSAEDHARWCGTIPYEILCGVRAETRRVV